MEGFFTKEMQEKLNEIMREYEIEIPSDAVAYCIEQVYGRLDKFDWCHDCKEYDQEKHCCHRWSKVIRDTLNHMPKRKKGHWVKVYGYYTPGGDPVWKCSECGKGIHVYGIEAPSYNRDYADGQWVACPNCGADMEGEE